MGRSLGIYKELMWGNPLCGRGYLIGGGRMWLEQN